MSDPRAILARNLMVFLGETSDSRWLKHKESTMDLRGFENDEVAFLATQMSNSAIANWASDPLIKSRAEDVQFYYEASKESRAAIAAFNGKKFDCEDEEFQGEVTKVRDHISAFHKALDSRATVGNREAASALEITFPYGLSNVRQHQGDKLYFAVVQLRSDAVANASNPYLDPSIKQVREDLDAFAAFISAFETRKALADDYRDKVKANKGAWESFIGAFESLNKMVFAQRTPMEWATWRAPYLKARAARRAQAQKDKDANGQNDSKNSVGAPKNPTADTSITPADAPKKSEPPATEPAKDATKSTDG
jgi:hypothetical protein